MQRNAFVAVALIVVVGAAPARGAGRSAAAPAGEPILRLEADGPTSYVNTLAWIPDGQRLYAAGFDKVVRVWRREAASGRLVLDDAAFRVPIGPGVDGAINAIALSPDGVWLAVAGKGLMTGRAGFRQPGLVLPVLSAVTPAMRLEQGAIWLFNTRTQEARSLRGHRGEVLALAFAPDAAGQLVSAGVEYSERKGEDTRGVIHLWDITKPDSRAALIKRWDIRAIEPERTARPTLALWHVGRGNALADVRVALTWGSDDGVLRLLDPGRAAATELAGTRAAPVYTVAAVPGRRALITGGFRGTGQLQLWNTGGDGKPEMVQEAAVGGGEGTVIPWSVTPFASETGRAVNSAVVLVRVPGGESGGRDAYRLLAIDLAGDHFGDRGEAVQLWRSGSVQTVAASASALALAGAPDHGIAVFSFADLRRGRAEPERLASRATPFRSVQFVRQKEKTGLRLVPSSEGGQDEDSLVFDFEERRLVAPANWEDDSPNVPGWTAQAHRPAADDEAAHWSITVRDPDGAETAIELRPGQTVSARLALLPPRASVNVPLVAVAYHEAGQPTLAVYDARSGTKLREFSGHTAAINALAFQANGRLLASTAADQTACVWSLADLNQVLGQRGGLPGVLVRSDRGKLVVARSEAKTPAAQFLADGDAIEGVVTSGELRTLETPADFYRTLADHRPETEITLRVNGKDVPVRLGQAADERKPLFTFFVTRGARLEDRQWVCWSPSGPYDSSGRRAERLVGWHFNTGRAERPTTFAPADRYRKEYYRPGLLKHLVARADLPAALESLREEEHPHPPPDLQVRLEADQAPSARETVDGMPLWRSPPTTLTVGILNDYPAERIVGVRYRLDRWRPESMERRSGREWSGRLFVPLQSKWQRGRHEAEVTLEASNADGERRTYRAAVAFFYQPPPPTIDMPSPGMEAKVIRDQPDYLFRANVTPGERQEPVPLSVQRERQRDPDLLRLKVTLFHRYTGSVDRWDDGPRIARTLTLRPGANTIEVEARNRDALAGHEERETTRKAITVFYAPKAAPPRISLGQIVAGPSTGAVTAIVPGRPTVVQDPFVRIQGRIDADEPMTSADWFMAGAKPRALAAFQKNDRSVVLDERLPRLRPGPQTFHITARTASSDPASADLVVDYRPRLPHVVLLEVKPGTDIIEGAQPPEVRLTARLIEAGDEAAYEPRVFVNGKAVQATVGREQNTLTARVPLPEPRVRDNRVRLQITDHWGTTEAAEVNVRYLRPPEIVRVEAPEGQARSPVRFTVWLKSPTAPTAVEAHWRKAGVESGAGQARRFADATDLKPERAEEGVWKVALPAVEVEAGRLAFQFVADNADGTCLRPQALDLAVAAENPPKITIDTPATAVNVRDRRLRLRFRVRSERSPLEQVEVRRGYEVLYRASDTERRTGVFETEAELARGANNLFVVTANRGGAQWAAFPTISYTPPPVQVALDQLETRAAPPQVVRPQPSEDAAGVFEAVADGQLVLHGHVEFSDPQDPRLARNAMVRVWVNCFQQMPVPLEPASDPGSGSRPFTARIQLNQRDNNRIEVELPQEFGLGAGPRWIVRSCARPVAGQRLHLLVVGAGEKDRERLMERALRAVQARREGERLVALPAFGDVRLYGPLTGTVDRNEVYGQMSLIRREVERAHRQEGGLNDVVMMYYQGTELINERGHFFLTCEGPEAALAEELAIRCDFLAGYFAEAPVAQVLLFDVVRGRGVPPQQDQIAQMPPEERLGIFRYTVRGTTEPEPAPLIAAWSEVVPHAGLLREVADRLAQTLRGRPYDRHLPASLEGLVVGPAGRRGP